MIKTYSLLLIIFLLSESQNQHKINLNNYITTAKNLLKRYPESRLVDVYKYFHQGRFGPEHLIRDSLIALEFLRNELNIIIDSNSDSALIEYIMPENKYVRVDLKLIKRKIIPIELFFTAFYQSATYHDSLQHEKWKEDWRKICSEIEKNKLPIKDFENDKTRITHNLNQNKFVFSHSLEYKRNYKPMYRVIDRNIFEKFILPLLKNQKVNFIK